MIKTLSLCNLQDRIKQESSLLSPHPHRNNALGVDLSPHLLQRRLGRPRRRRPRPGVRGLGQPLDSHPLAVRRRVRQLLPLAPPAQQLAQPLVQRVLADQLQLQPALGHGQGHRLQAAELSQLHR